jgi:hypothetical protein
MADIVKQKTETLVIHRTINYALIALIFIAALSYIYFANIAVRTLTVLEKTRNQMQSLSVEVGEMESKRLSVENSISAEKALLLGFVEVNNPIFIMKGSQNTLSLKK